MSIHLKYGKCYVDGWGNVRGPLVLNTDDDADTHPFTDGSDSWRIDGKCYFDGTAPNMRDLIAEVTAKQVDDIPDNLSLRDWFAGQIASGMASFSGTAGISYGPDEIAGRAYQVADAMLKAREAE